MQHKSILLTALVAALQAAPAIHAAPTESPLWLRDVQISPNGDMIAFTYKGDIWTVPVEGGDARQLTVRETYEANPLWSPDGKQIAFASDRNGNLDIYVMDATGGTPKRLTSNSANEIPEGFSPDGKEVYYSAAIQAPASSAMFPTGRMTQLYAVDIATGKTRQVLGTPAKEISFSPDGSKMLYTDVKGFEDEWRKHHTSSVTRDIWLYNPKTGAHQNLTNRPGEDRNAILDAATETVYLLSERDGGTFNVYTFPLSDPSQATRLTDFKTHPVRFLSRANNGTLAFTFDGEIYTMNGRAARAAGPQKVDIRIATDDTQRPKRLSVKPEDGIVSPDGKMVAFLNRGDVFVTSVEYPTTVQVTDTPQAERDISWGADNRSLYFTSERSGRKNIYKATIARKDDPDFPNAVEFTQTALFPEYKGEGKATEYSHPFISPDGKKMIYIKDRNQLWIRDLKSGADRAITHGETYPGREDEMTLQWSPDSKWITMEMVPDMRDPYSDIALIEVETGKVINLTNSGYFEQNPRFVLDGNAIIYFTEQYGMRAQASWGSQDDIMIVFLNREARDRFMLSEEELALLKEQEKKAEKPAATDKKDDSKGSKKDESSAEKPKKDKTINVELEGIEDRIVRLTPFSSTLSDAIVTADGETLYFLCKVEDGFDLWKLPLRKREPQLAAKMGTGGSSLQADKDGKQIFVIGKEMKKLDKGDKLTPIKVSATHNVDLAAEREAMFDYVAVEEGERFYDTGMHGVDWPAMTAAYRRFLPHINNNYDFAEMLSELLGELNVSHTGGRYYGSGNSSSADRTASLGLLYDMNYTGNGLKVDEVLSGGPFDKASSKIAKGAVITAVNGQKIDAGADLGELFNNLAGKKILVAFTTPEGTDVQEVVTPCSAAAISDIMYRRWVKQRAADVDRWSNGRLGYVHIASMNDASYRPMYADLLGKYNNREGVVIDIRWNGGGRMHEDIEQLFTGEKYLTQVIRGKDVCDMPSRRWNKPSIMLVAEPCYSNAHGTPWVYQHQKIGKVVGMPVPGTMTSVNWVTLQDPSLVFGIPVIGYRTAEGNYLENTQLEPDVKVANTPETIVIGEDTQLRTAVETLLKDIDSRR